MIKILENISLAKYTTFGIGGSAEFFIEVDNSQKLEEALIWANKHKIKISILGGGSNLLISDKGIKGLVIRFFGTSLTVKDTVVSCFAGCPMQVLVQKTMALGLSGLEYFVGLPGSVGGAIYKNSHWRMHNVSDHLEKIKVFDFNANKKILLKEDLDFRYDFSSFQKNHLIISELTFRFEHADKKILEMRAKEVLDRRALHPKGKSAGCVFKNVNDRSAGRIIDAAGLAGERLGDIEVSKIHANFLINNAQGKSSDVYRLIRKVQKDVLEKKKVNLEPEIFFWGDFDE
jgi:UDP-N-acetylmuramate dehydrogenase